MIIKFIGDIHISKRMAHSTKASNQRFQTFKQGLTMDYVMEPGLTVQMGDLFDGFTCNNSQLRQAFDIAKHCDYIIGGNHDFSHDTSKVSALQDLANMVQCHVIGDEVHCEEIDNKVQLVLVPYAATQELFAQFLEDALGKASRVMPSILCLHTNYDNKLAQAEIENNVGPKMANRLNMVFDHVISGHEHQFNDSRPVTMTGAILPLTFGEMTDKYYLEYDTKTGEMGKVRVWDAERHYLSCDVEEFLAILRLEPELQFIEVTGEIIPAEILPVAKKMNEFFKLDHIFAIRNDTRMAKVEGEEIGTDVKKLDWVDMVKEQLNDEQLKLFEELI